MKIVLVSCVNIVYISKSGTSEEGYGSKRAILMMITRSFSLKEITQNP
jgi:hypothetical protein